ncbi:Secreted phosphoprotein 24 [Caenorhabditis elegans]|uniref:Secreted phosphoprotein 24 n=2 Tax=Caenorhabditis elegans TaxID=6239 RepID=Q7YTT9_CAEEL|nr:Secreted phosphoprotein 24 [Caenorhabditis elegans]CAD98732.2 Secreted phosphoprotein 24 [Caenorhabditis elegans]|eukprot:NP_001021882.2 Uncharacterized protein CELE_ZK909.6 [Caenorhabditis elegans]
MFYKSMFVLLISCLMGVAFVASFPIEMKNIQYLFPPQNTVIADENSYKTKIDRQVGDSEEEDNIRKSCVQKQNAEKSEEETSPPSSDADLPTSLADSFNDTTPYNGTIVDDRMEVKIYRPECDD